MLSAGLALILAACAALPSLQPTPSETPKPRSSRTHRPTRTPKPTETPSAIPQPTASLAPTVPLPLPSATPSPTVLSASPTATPLPPSALDCNLVWQSPPNGSVYYPGNKFSVGWKIKNVGTTAWEPGTFRFVYLGGARLAPGYQVPLSTSVAPGASVVLSVPMRASWHLGVYTTHWGIRQGDAFFCRLTLTIQVQSP